MKASPQTMLPVRMFAILFFPLLLCFCTSSAKADFQKTKIAVLDFESVGEKLEPADMGEILSEWIITSLVKSGRFDVVERAMLQKVISEQQLSTTGAIDEQGAATLGKILGVKIVISGSLGKQGDTMEIQSRVISVENGSIIAVESIRNDSRKDLHALVEQLTTKIMRNFPLVGFVVKKNPTSVIIDLGLDAGLSSGTEFIVYREGEIIKHPKTGEVLDVEEIPTGRLRIAKVSKNVAEGDILSQEAGGILAGHLVKSIRSKKTDSLPSRANKADKKKVSIQ
jgi:TolB-like protein